MASIPPNPTAAVCEPSTGQFVRLRRRLLSVPPWLRWGACFVYLGVIAVLSLAPPDAFPSSVTSLPGADKVVHFLMYGGLAAMLRWAMERREDRERRVFVLAGAIGYGLSMEICQSLFTHGTRGFGWDDVAANAAGAIGLWALAGWWLGAGSTEHGAGEKDQEARSTEHGARSRRVGPRNQRTWRTRKRGGPGNVEC